MRIGINEVLLYNHSGGAQQRELSVLPELLQQIADRGWESVVYVARGASAELVEKLTAGGPCNIVRTPIPAVPTYKRLILGVPYWRKQVEKDRLSLFHTAYYPSPSLKIPTVFTVHDVRFAHMPETYTKGRLLFLKMFVPRTFRTVQRIVTVSQDTKNDLVTLWGIDPSKIDVSYNAITHLYAPVTQKENLLKVKSKYKLPDKFILCVSHLEPRKNLRRLLQAYIHMCAQHDLPYSLVILGKPIFGFESLFQEVTESALEKKVLFTGFVEDEDMAAVYSQAAVLAFPSLHEGFGMPAVEAMACGVPVVASNVSALPEICGSAAVLVDPYSVESIKDGIYSVLLDLEKRQKLVAKGFERGRLFSAANAASTIILAYEKVMTP